MKIFWLLMAIGLHLNLAGQNPFISEMRWGVDYKIYIGLSNDTNFVYDVKALHHTGSLHQHDTSQITYYPVNLDPDFVNALKETRLPEPQTNEEAETGQDKPATLWSALHNDLGGGKVHFINCMLYALETRQLALASPLMKRPETNWKPKPMTESFKRTRKWEFYVPVLQKDAQKEYKTRLKEGKLSELAGVPMEYIRLFLQTNENAYQKLSQEKKYNELAQIDLVKLLLGAPYLGKNQINFIRSRVLKAVQQYTANNLPSVIVFDDFNAAVAMTLDEKGYKAEKIIFSDFENLSFEEAEARREKIKTVIIRINEANQRVFKENLKRHYN